MKKIFTLVAAAFVAVGVSAQVNSTRVELTPANVDVDNTNKSVWKFTNTDITISNTAGNRSCALQGWQYPNNNGDTVTVDLIKVSKDYEFTFNIPDDRAVVRIEFWGVTNSADGNWSYIHKLYNTSELKIFEQTGGANNDGRDIMDNTEIQTTCTYPISPYTETVNDGPKAVFEDKLGWFSEITFQYDGNNQVASAFVLYTVPEADLASYDPAKDETVLANTVLTQIAENENYVPPVQSTRVELSPLYADAANCDAATWRFTNTDITITNVDSRNYASTGRYIDAATSVDATPEVADTTVREFMKMSKDKEFKIVIPEDRAVVRVEFWGFSNSSAMNWAYLCYLNNTAELPILSGIDRDIMDNEAIKVLAHPFNPEAEAAEVAPLAVFEDKLGWFSELSFLFDGNNQVGANIVVYTVPEADLANYDPAKDGSIKSQLDMPVVEEPSAIESVENDEVKTLDPNAPMYNILGQPVGADYKGIVIQKGAKFILR